MWKYVSRRLRDTLEKSANYFDIRSTTGVANASNSSRNANDSNSSPPCRWFSPRKCWNSHQEHNDTNSKRWNFDTLNRTWLGAITWSSALVIGWYTSQVIHLKYKCRYKNDVKACASFQNLVNALSPFAENDYKRGFLFEDTSSITRIVESFAPTVHLVSNETGGKKRTKSGSSTTPDSSSSDLGDVLNSIENRLGLAAIENGQHQDGLKLLKSAANRNHAPAIYNLGLCYELGLGVSPDEKMAMELYRSAAALEHPSAMYNLGIYYGQGRGGLTRNIETATRLLRLAALKGNEDAADALKSLDIPTIEEPEPQTYNFSPYVQTDNLVPPQISLFAQNVAYLTTKPVY